MRSTSEQCAPTTVHKERSLSTPRDALSTVRASPSGGIRAKPGPPGRSRGATRSVGVEELANSPDVPPKVVVLSHFALDLFAAVQDRRVVSPAEGLADPEEWRLCLFAHEVHRDLTREDHLLVASLPLDLIQRNPVVARDRLDDALG